MSEEIGNTETVRLALEGEMTIYHAQEIKEQMLAGLESCGKLELDLSQVGEIDTAGLQLLIMAKREAGRTGKALQLVAHSTAVREVLDFYDMAAFFGDPLVIPAREHA